MIERNHGLRFTFHVSRLPPPVSSTYSLVARDPAMGWLGSAVASRYFGVGAVVPHLRAGVGAWNTQHNHHHLLAMRGLDLLATGVDPDTALKMVLAGDPVPETRQLLVIDAQGRRAAWTGTACHEARGHLFGEHCIAAGNTLVSLRVVEALVEAFEGHLTEPFGRRLLLALEAAEAEGGDSRGKQSAAIRVVPALLSDWLSDVVDLRVDDHEEPLAELRRLYEKRWAGH